MNLKKEILNGNPRAIAKAISLVENDSVKAQSLMKEIFPQTGGSLIIGITGAPGSGKSTLVDKLITKLSEDQKKIGVIAVDPSSPFSGGAIMGDRIRMMRHSENPDVFIRSMATRGHLGGLTKATGEAISIMEASGKGVILIETVGVGQDEVEVVKMADVILVVLIPGAGDDIQAFKAGIMEIADIFVINKADSPDADKLDRQLHAMLDLGLKDRPVPKIVRTIATQGEGIEELYKKTLGLSMIEEGDSRTIRKKRLVEWMLKDIINAKISRAVQRQVRPKEFASFVEKIYLRKIDPYSAADQILARLKGN
jgi:LAO/AO transport system kinase